MAEMDLNVNFQDNGAVEGLDKINQGLDGITKSTATSAQLQFNEALRQSADIFKTLSTDFVSIATNQGNALRQFQRIGDAIGQTVDQVEALDKVAKVAGLGGMSDLYASSNRLLTKLVDTKGNLSDLGEQFSKIGVSVTDAFGNVRDQSSVLDDVVSKLATLGDHTKATQLAYKAGRGDMVAFVNSVRQQGGSLEAAKKKMEEYSYASDDLIQKQIQLVKELGKTNIIWDEFQEVTGGKVATVVLPILEKLNNLLHEIGKNHPDLAAMLGGIEPLVKNFPQIIQTLANLRIATAGTGLGNLLPGLLGGAGAATGTSLINSIKPLITEGREIAKEINAVKESGNMGYLDPRTIVPGLIGDLRAYKQVNTRLLVPDNPNYGAKLDPKAESGINTLKALIEEQKAIRTVEDMRKFANKAAIADEANLLRAETASAIERRAAIAATIEETNALRGNIAARVLSGNATAIERAQTTGNALTRFIASFLPGSVGWKEAKTAGTVATLGGAIKSVTAPEVALASGASALAGAVIGKLVGLIPGFKNNSFSEGLIDPFQRIGEIWDRLKSVVGLQTSYSERSTNNISADVMKEIQANGQAKVAVGSGSVETIKSQEELNTKINEEATKIWDSWSVGEKAVYGFQMAVSDAADAMKVLAKNTWETSTAYKDITKDVDKAYSSSSLITDKLNRTIDALTTGKDERGNPLNKWQRAELQNSIKTLQEQALNGEHNSTIDANLARDKAALAEIQKQERPLQEKLIDLQNKFRDANAPQLNNLTTGITTGATAGLAAGSLATVPSIIQQMENKSKISKKIKETEDALSALSQKESPLRDQVSALEATQQARTTGINGAIEKQKELVDRTKEEVEAGRATDEQLQQESNKLDALIKKREMLVNLVEKYNLEQENIGLKTSIAAQELVDQNNLSSSGIDKLNNKVATGRFADMIKLATNETRLAVIGGANEEQTNADLANKILEIKLKQFKEEYDKASRAIQAQLSLLDSSTKLSITLGDNSILSSLEEKRKAIDKNAIALQSELASLGDPVEQMKLDQMITEERIKEVTAKMEELARVYKAIEDSARATADYWSSISSLASANRESTAFNNKNPDLAGVKSDSELNADAKSRAAKLEADLAPLQQHLEELKTKASELGYWSDELKRDWDATQQRITATRNNSEAEGVRAATAQDRGILQFNQGELQATITSAESYATVLNTIANASKDTATELLNLNDAERNLTTEQQAFNSMNEYFLNRRKAIQGELLKAEYAYRAAISDADKRNDIDASNKYNETLANTSNELEKLAVEEKKFNESMQLRPVQEELSWEDAKLDRLKAEHASVKDIAALRQEKIALLYQESSILDKQGKSLEAYKKTTEAILLSKEKDYNLTFGQEYLRAGSNGTQEKFLKQYFGRVSSQENPIIDPSNFGKNLGEKVVRAFHDALTTSGTGVIGDKSISKLLDDRIITVIERLIGRS